MAKFIQPAFSRGEVAPDLYGRVDTQAYQLALKTARNLLIHTYGGASNRPGTIFVGAVYDHTRYTRLIPFQFKTTDRHVIELGHEYIRFLRNDAHITESGLTVTNATKADPVEITTSASHGYSTGDEVFLTAIGGMTEITETVWKIKVTAADKFTLASQIDNSDLDGTGFTAYTSGGQSKRLYSIASPYQEADLRNIKITQTADVVTLVHPSYGHRELRRLGLTNWQLVEVDYVPDQAPPSNVTVTPRSTGTEVQKYKVTATSGEDEESLPGLSDDTPLTITNATQADPCQVTSTGHGLSDGDEIKISGVVGMTELNDRRYRVNKVDADNIQLRDINSTNFTAYSSGGQIDVAFKKITNGHADFLNDISWGAVPGVRFYSVYREQNGVYGFIGETEGLLFADDATAITPNLTETPPQERNPFFGEGNYPGAVGTHEQRKVLGGSANKPDTSFYSRIGLPNNFSVTIPTKSDDAITATLASREVNEIRHYVGLNDLLVFTSGAEWIINGSPDQGFTPSTIRQNFQSNWGSSHVPPVVVGSTVLFVLDNGAGVRSIGFAAQNQNIVQYNTRNVALLVPHLLRNGRIVESGFARVPEPIAFWVLDNGEVLTLTFDEEQEVTAWTHWDTLGLYESVAVSRPDNDTKEEVPYFVVVRSVNGQTVRYIERMDTRVFTDVRDCFFVDAGLTYDLPFAIEGLTFATVSEPWVVAMTGHPFVDGDQVDISDVEWEVTIDEDGNVQIPLQLNKFRFTVANAATDTFELRSLEDGRQICPDGLKHYEDLPREDGAVGYWRLNEPSGPTAADYSGNNHDGTYTNSPTLGEAGLLTSDPDTSVKFDHTANSRVVVSNHADFQPSSAFSFEIWCKVDGPVDIAGSHYELISNETFNASGSLLRVDVASGMGDNKAPITLRTNQAGAWTAVDSAPIVESATLYHIVATFDGIGTGNIYVNGVLIKSGPLDAPVPATADLTISHQSQAFTGWLDEAAVYNKELTLEEIQAHYQLGLGNFDTEDVGLWAGSAAYVGGGNARLAVQFISGMRHLEGEEVAILADGNVLPRQTVGAFGTLTLPRRFSRVHIGVPYISDLETLNIELPSGGTIQGEFKKIPNVNVRFERSRGLLVGPDAFQLTAMKQRENEALGEPTELLSGDKLITLPPHWNTNGRMFLRQKDPLPMTILALVPDVSTEDNEG